MCKLRQFIDDIHQCSVSSFSKTAAEHKKHVEIVLPELRKHKLTAPNPFVMCCSFVPDTQWCSKLLDRPLSVLRGP